MNFVALRSFDNYIAANLMMQRLENEGIKVYLKDEHTVTIDPILSHAIGGIKLMVYEPQLSRATELVEAMEAISRTNRGCPRCGSEKVEYVTEQKEIKNWISALLTWLLGSYALPITQIYHCYHCGHEFREFEN